MAKRLYLIAVGFLLALPLTAQSKPSAERPGISYWVGFSVSTFNPDYGCGSNSPFTCWNHQLIGISPYVHTSEFLFGRIGAEGQARFMHWHGPVNLNMDSYMGGPRVRLWSHKKLAFSGKFVLGIAHISVNPAVDGNYFAFAPGAAVDYRVTRHFSTRLDYEYQMWPSFKGTQTGPGHAGGLTPNGFSVGISYLVN